MSDQSPEPVRSTGTQLDTATKLVRAFSGTGWWLTVYPTAGEAGDFFALRSPRRGR